MSKRNIGNTVIVGLIVLNAVLWFIFPPHHDGREHWTNQYIGEVLSTSALILMSVGIVLANRVRPLEPFFGGLDRMYVTHRLAAIAAMALVVMHISAIVLGRGVSLGFSFGKLAFFGLFTLALLALAPRLPWLRGAIRLKYHDWHFSHRFIGLFFIIGLVHHFRVDNLLATTTPVQVYVLSISGIGVAAYLYKELLAPWLHPGAAYTVEQVKRFNNSVTEVTLRPHKNAISFKAGQFLSVRFPTDRILREAHPFTISSTPEEQTLRLTIRASGDFTQYLYENLAPGMPARVHGGYGRFDYRQGAREQVWVAGGIGLTPFLSWMRDFQHGRDYEIDFFYSLRNAADGLYLDEITSIAASHPNLRLHVHDSEKSGRLTAEKIIAASGSVIGKEIYLCGPLPMTQSLREQLIRSGVNQSKIHFEEFNFR